MCTFAEINRPRGQQNPCASRNADHLRDADARTARNTAVNWAASSMPDATRTTAPASLTSIAGAADGGVTRETDTACGTSVEIGTKSGGVTGVNPVATAVTARHAARRQP